MTNFNQIHLCVEQFDKSGDCVLFDFVTAEEFLYVKSNGNTIPNVQMSYTEPTMIMVQGIKNANLHFTEGVIISVPAGELLQATQASSANAADNIAAFLIVNDERFNNVLYNARTERGF